MVESLYFETLEPTFVPVAFGPNKEKKCVLCSASEGAAVQYRNAALKAAKMVDGKIVGMDGVANAEPLLVSLCTSPEDHNHPGQPRRDTNGNPVPTPLNVVMSWPPHVVAKLFETIKAISPGLEEKETREVLEKRFGETTEKLAALSTNDGERRQWREWMARVCEEKCGVAPHLGGEGDPDPMNGLPSAGTVTSVSLAS